MAEDARVGAQEFADLFRRASNWGRWGSDDQRGALNHIGPEQRCAAASLVREGVTVSCSHPLNKEPQVHNPFPALHFMARSADALPEARFTADFLALAPHGFAHTHLDALCHYFWAGAMYNGHPISAVTSLGAGANAITIGQDGIVGRGVLLDLAGARGGEWLEPGQAMGVEDLEAAEARQGVRVRQGDVLLVRTGRLPRQRALGAWNPRQSGLAGLHVRVAPWLHDRGVALVGCDGITDTIPAPVDLGGYSGQPLHVLTLVAMGAMLIDNAQLEDVAAACRRFNRWEFMFTLTPLRLPGGTASPVNPIAIF